jgi:soluble lytic murein transglycosylase-like protein
MKVTLLLLTSLIWPLHAQAADARWWADYWADTYGLPRELVRAVIETESGWNSHAVSPAGAVGLMQLMPNTAVAFGVRNRFDTPENIRGGVAYLAWLKKQCGGDWRLMLASYTAGPGRVLRQGLNFDSEPVHRYIERVASLYRRNRLETLLRSKTEEP